MQMGITKSQLMAALGFEKQTELAGYFGLTVSAISQWADDEPVPELRELQARQRSPHAFVQPADAGRADAHPIRTG